uniref:Uncharacterized protein n=2 Tax=Caenorhabditis japonica TaxID=281687 RepID=A0A8R1E934_CAEJA
MDGYLTGSGPLLPPPSSQKEDQPRKYRLAKRPRTSHRTKSTATDENLWFTKTDTACQTDTSHRAKLPQKYPFCDIVPEDIHEADRCMKKWLLQP